MSRMPSTCRMWYELRHVNWTPSSDAAARWTGAALMTSQAARSSNVLMHNEHLFVENREKEVRHDTGVILADWQTHCPLCDCSLFCREPHSLHWAEGVYWSFHSASLLMVDLMQTNSDKKWIAKSRGGTGYYGHDLACSGMIIQKLCCLHWQQSKQHLLTA